MNKLERLYAIQLQKAAASAHKRAEEYRAQYQCACLRPNGSEAPKALYEAWEQASQAACSLAQRARKQWALMIAT